MTKHLLLAALAALATPIASAQDGAALVQTHNCGKTDATAALVPVIKNGIRSGAVAMPPTSVSDADARAMASYILSLRK